MPAGHFLPDAVCSAICYVFGLLLSINVKNKERVQLVVKCGEEYRNGVSCDLSKTAVYTEVVWLVVVKN